jgi:uroporphyrinogen III methyltransferase/synthase
MHPSGDQPLRGKRVLITRAGEQSESLASALRAQGAQPLIAPTIAIRALDDLSALDDAIDRLGDFSWIAFTSQNGVDVFMAHLAQRNETAAAVKIAAIGEQTANRLRLHGAHVALIAEQHVSEALAQELIAVTSPGERVLLVRALEGREVLTTMLESAGIEVTTVPAYRTVTAHDPDFAGKVRLVDTITFTSASTVRGFSTLLHGRAAESVGTKCVVCIGPVTAEAARRHGLHVNVIAAHHTASGLLDALRSHYGARP